MIKLYTTLFLLFIFGSVEVLFAQTVLYPGDLAVVGLASNVGGDLGDCTPDGSGQFLGRDRVSFIAFKDIEPGTTIDITDNGWERENPGLWGNTEGFIRTTRTGSLIPAGTLITFEFPPTTTGYTATSPDGDWTFTLLGTNALNFNDSGDQIYFLQGGNWDNGTVLGCCNGEQDASYTGGRILFGFNSKSVWNGFLEDSQNSALHPDVSPCFNMAPTSGITSFTSYSGPVSETSQLEWISRIGNPDNWTAYGDCPNYQDPPANFAIGPSGLSIACKICQFCGIFQDTLNISVPSSGGPVEIVYTNGMDTLQMTGLTSDTMVTVSVTNSVSYRLISVTDGNSCPVYSNFGSGADLIVSNNPPALTCEPTAPAPDGNVSFTVDGGLAPFTISWMDEQGTGGNISGDGAAPITISGLTTQGIYQVEVRDAAGCTDQCSFELEGPDCTMNLMLDLGFDTDVQLGQGVFIDPLINFIPASVSWAPETAVEDPTSISTTIRPERTTLYTATATDLNGCSVSDSILIRVTNEEMIFIPSAFSPNEDGVNDRFLLFPGPEVSEIRSLRVFDRWGNMVYLAESISSNNDGIGWDGGLPNRRPAAAGIYLYFAEVMDQTGNAHIFQGSVTLIR